MSLDNYETTRSPYCGRLDKHAAHQWLGRDTQPAVPRIVRECPGAPVIEGGAGPHFIRNWSDVESEEPVEPLGPRALELARKNCETNR